MPKLNAKQRKFYLHYIEHGNGTKAAIHAGYSKKTAASIACQLLKNIKIQEAIEDEFATRGLDIDYVVAEHREQIHATTKLKVGEEDAAGGDGEVRDINYKFADVSDNSNRNRAIENYYKITGRMDKKGGASLTLTADEPEDLTELFDHIVDRAARKTRNKRRKK